jgi:hypothetical protein
MVHIPPSPSRGELDFSSKGPYHQVGAKNFLAGLGWRLVAIGFLLPQYVDFSIEYWSIARCVTGRSEASPIINTREGRKDEQSKNVVAGSAWAGSLGGLRHWRFGAGLVAVWDPGPHANR